MLALVVERVSGMPYERYTRETLLEPLGIRTSMRVGRTLPEGRSQPANALRYEAVYHQPAGHGRRAERVPVGARSGARTPTASGTTRAWRGPAAGSPRHPRWSDSSTPSSAVPGTPVDVQPDDAGRHSGAAVVRAECDQLDRPWLADRAGVAAGNRIRFAGGLRGTMSVVYYLPNGRSYAYITNYSEEGNDNDATPLDTRIFNGVASLPGATNDLSTNPAYIDSTAVMPQIRAQKGVVDAASGEPGIAPASRFAIVGWRLAAAAQRPQAECRRHRSGGSRSASTDSPSGSTL